MECLTFRRTKLAVPHDPSADLIEHARGCAACSAFAREIDEFERRLHEAARLAVPEGLAEQIILRYQHPGGFSRACKLVRSWLAPQQYAPSRLRHAYTLVAALIVLSVATAVGITVTGARTDPADRFIAHVIAEPEVLRDRSSVELAKFDQTVARYGGQVHEPIGVVHHLGNCLIDGVVAQHILVQTPYGTATLILIPKRMPATSEPRTRDGYSVVVIPLRDGSLGIVTDSPDKTRRVEDLLKKRVTWEG